MKEKDLQRTVEEMAALYGWLVFHDNDSRRNRPGFPDLVLVHPLTGDLLFRELKSEKGRITREQTDWITALQRGRHDAAIWRPKHLENGLIQHQLSRGYAQ